MLLLITLFHFRSTIMGINVNLYYTIHHYGVYYIQGGLNSMKILSAGKLAKTVTELRNNLDLTQAELGERTGLHRIMIGRIEREDFIPSIVQLQALGDTLGFDITEMFVEQERSNSFVALRGGNLSEAEREGVDTLLSMMLALRQQIIIRRKFERASRNKTNP